MKQIVKRYPVTVFYLLAFVISWLGWMPQALHGRDIFPFDSPLFNLLGAGGPTLAAVIVVWLRSGRNQVGGLFSGLGRWRVSLTNYLFALGYWFVAAGLSLALMALAGYQLPNLGKLPWLGLAPIFLAMLLSNVWEEIGWRGFALPELQKKYDDRQIALLMGLLWSLWHIPLMLTPASPMADLPWFWEVLFSLGLTVIYTWLFNQTGGSLLLVSLFHAISNTVASLMLEGGVFLSSYPFVVGVTCVTALAVLLLSRRHRRFGS